MSSGKRASGRYLLNCSLVFITNFHLHGLINNLNKLLNFSVQQSAESYHRGFFITTKLFTSVLTSFSLNLKGPWIYTRTSTFCKSCCKFICFSVVNLRSLDLCKRGRNLCSGGNSFINMWFNIQVFFCYEKFYTT